MAELQHYGLPRRSGRYKWGSGEDPYHHGADGPKQAKMRGRSLSAKIARKADSQVNKMAKKLSQLEKKHQTELQKAKYKKQKKKYKEELREIKRGRKKMTKPKTSDDYKNEISAKAKTMSNEELNAAINRMQLQKRYVELITPQANATKSKGASMAKRILKTLGDSTVSAVGDVGKQYMKYQLGTYINKKTGQPVVKFEEKKKDKDKK